MNIIFTDRFNRKWLDLKFLNNKIGYDQVRNSATFNRDTLPSTIWLNGSIVWINTKLKLHCITGPSTSRIYGDLVYQINEVEMTKMEWLLAIEK